MRGWVALVATLVAIKAAWLAADATPMLFLGDSESYLATATHGWIPPDRSFLYGFLLRPLVMWTGSMTPLVVAQAACSIVVALVLAALLVGAFAVPRLPAAAVAILWGAIEPLALLYERFVMSEAFTLAAFAAFVATSIRYLHTTHGSDLVLANLAGTLVIALRTMFVPVSIAFAMVLPLLAWVGRSGHAGAGSRLRGLAMAVMVSLLSMAGLHQLYKVVHGQVGGRVAYSAADGLFLLAAWAPVVRASDFRDPVLGARVLASSRCDPADRLLRDAQRWQPDCIVGALIVAAGRESVANLIARDASRNALRRDPAGVAALAVATWLDGLNPERVRDGMISDRGTRLPAPATVALLRDRLGVDNPETLHLRATPAKRWHERAVGWVIGLSLSPLLALIAVFVAPRNVRRNLVFVFLLLACMIGSAALGGTQFVPRYLHAVAWLVMIPLTVIGAWVVRAVAPRARAQVPAG